MRYLKLKDLEAQTLREGYENHPKFHMRNRCHALLLSFEGVTIPTIKSILNTRRRTVYSWMNRWEEKGIVGLMSAPGRGVKSKLSEEHKDQIKKSQNIRT